MSLNAHKALQLFYTETRDQLCEEAFVHRAATIPADWEYAKDKLVPVETTLRLVRPTPELVTLMFFCGYMPAERLRGGYPTVVSEMITISHDKAMEIWASYTKDEQWLCGLLSQVDENVMIRLTTNEDRERQQKAIRDTYLKAYHVALPQPVVMLLDDLDHLEKDGPSINLAWKFLHNFINVDDPQVTFSVKKNTLKLDILGREVSTYRLRPEVEKLQNFTFYQPK